MNHSNTSAVLATENRAGEELAFSGSLPSCYWPTEFQTSEDQRPEYLCYELFIGDMSFDEQWKYKNILTHEQKTLVQKYWMLTGQIDQKLFPSYNIGNSSGRPDKTDLKTHIDSLFESTKKVEHNAHYRYYTKR